MCCDCLHHLQPKLHPRICMRQSAHTNTAKHKKRGPLTKKNSDIFAASFLSPHTSRIQRSDTSVVMTSPVSVVEWKVDKDLIFSIWDFKFGEIMNRFFITDRSLYLICFDVTRYGVRFCGCCFFPFLNFDSLVFWRTFPLHPSPFFLPH